MKTARNALVLVLAVIACGLAVFGLVNWATTADAANRAEATAGLVLINEVCGDPAADLYREWAGRSVKSKWDRETTILACEAGAIKDKRFAADADDADPAAATLTDLCAGQSPRVLFANRISFKWNHKSFYLVACGADAELTPIADADSYFLN